jgi:lycopene cyclase domain-containing protein
MSYTVLAAAAVILAVAIDRWVLRTRLLCSRDFWAAYAILLFFQLLTNGVLTGLRIVRYSPASILGLRVAFAPVEDLAFGFALITITLCCWARLTAAPAAAGDAAAPGPRDGAESTTASRPETPDGERRQRATRTRTI